MRLAKYTIGARIFGAFVIMSAIIGVMGLAGYGVLSAAGGIAINTFDGPLMTINYARAAQYDFAEMKRAEPRFEHARSAAEREAIAEEIGSIFATFQDDLDVAAERSGHADEKAMIAQIRPLAARWREARGRGDIAALPALEVDINEKFDLLIEYATGHSFVGRRQTVDNINNYKYTVIGVSLLALLLAGAITWNLRRRIVQPLSAAATVADRIARGELQTPIPEGGGDETGALLNSMTVMQDNIRQMMARETAMRRSAESRLSDALETSNEGVMLVAPDGHIALANMSHELRTPLNAIIGFSEIISGELFGKLGNDRYLDYSKDILGSGRHLLAVINDVLDLVKSESGKMSLKSQDLDMCAMLEDCVAMMREQCREAGLTLAVHGLDQPLPLSGDPAKLRQIFLNLLSNAVKFTAAGGEITLAAQTTADTIIVTVGDTGIGMSAEDIEIAMQPFSQVDNRLERRYEGTGLGLPLTKSLAELHGASLVIESERQKGTKVIVTFPRLEPLPLAEAI